MPRVDREGRNEYRRERYAANIERERAKGREKMRRLRTANPDMVGRGRANALEWRNNNVERARGNSRRWAMQSLHGADVELVIARMFDEQNGLCYLCEKPLPDEGRDRNGYIDHNHACEHPIGGTCSACRRGLAHHWCNTLIGLLGDDPALLELIAANLRRETARTAMQIAEKAVAETLF